MRNAHFLPLALATTALMFLGLRATADELAAKRAHGSDGRSQKDDRGAGADAAATKHRQKSDGHSPKGGQGSGAGTPAGKHGQGPDGRSQKGGQGSGVGAAATKHGQKSDGRLQKDGQGTGVRTPAGKHGQGPDGRSQKGSQGTGVGAAATKRGQGSDTRMQKSGRDTGVGAATPEYGQLSECRYLYIWAGHVDHRDCRFPGCDRLRRRLPGLRAGHQYGALPEPGATFNEPHLMHMSVDGSILGCGGLLSVLSGQPGIFFFDTSNPRKPRFLFSTSDKFSSITDDFFPLPQGGFLITQMGLANGDAPGRVVEFDRELRQVGLSMALVAPNRRVQPTRHYGPT